MENALAREVARMESAGMKQVTLAQYARDIEAMGFRLDRSMDCRGVARDLESGESFPSLTSGARQISTGAGFANVAADRTCPGWQAFKEYRMNHFAIVRGAVFTV